jgi:hypothetical protein
MCQWCAGDQRCKEIGEPCSARQSVCAPTYVRDDASAKRSQFNLGVIIGKRRPNRRARLTAQVVCTVSMKKRIRLVNARFVAHHVKMQAFLATIPSL